MPHVLTFLIEHSPDPCDKKSYTEWLIERVTIKSSYSISFICFSKHFKIWSL